MSEAKLRTVVFYEHYFSEFYLKQRQRVKDKIVWTLRIIETQRHIPTDYLKHIEGTHGLYEIRVQHGGDVFRIFCFFDEGKLVVLANGFQKKTRKTPAEEIQRAIRIKRDYEQEKERENT
jgi:phage-related protein